MVKKENENAILIIKFLDKDYKPSYITQKLGISKQKISYWRKNEIKYVQT